MSEKPVKHLLFIFILMFCFAGLRAQETERVRVYRVQFAASKTFIQPSYFQKKFNLEDSIQYFEKDDYYKYYVGDFDTREEAVDYYHQTGDVGYVISMMVDKPVLAEQDTAQQVTEPDTITIEAADTARIDSLSVQVENQELEEDEGGEEKKEPTSLQRTLISLGFFLLVVLVLWLIISRIKRKSKAVVKDEEKDKEIEEDAGDDTVLDDSREEDDLLLLDDEGSADEPEEEDMDTVYDFSFLYDKNIELSEWEQLRILKRIRTGEIEVPEFSSWLGSENSSVVAFCLRMIRSLKQKNAVDKVLELLQHESDFIRAESIVTLGELGNVKALGILRPGFAKESPTNKILILRAMSRLPDESNINFLKELLRVDGHIQVEAAHALANIESVGIEGVERYVEELGINSPNIARHILINKL